MLDGSELTADELEFGRAVMEWRKRHDRRFPSLSDYLRILKGLGYRWLPDADAD